jgi:hypothetical protein
LNPPNANDASILIIANLGGTADIHPEEFAPVAAAWELRLDTEAPVYGGTGEKLSLSEPISIHGPRVLVFRAFPGVQH